MELGLSKKVVFRTLKGLFRHRCGTLGASTQLCVDSVASFEEFAASLQDDLHVLKKKHLTCSEQKVQWVAAGVPLLSAVEEAFKMKHAEYLMVAADWTHSLCHMGFQYGIVFVLAHRRLRGPVAEECLAHHGDVQQEGKRALLAGSASRRQGRVGGAWAASSATNPYRLVWRTEPG